VSLAVTAGVGLYLVLRVDWRILPIGLLGILMGYFYTAPPVKFGYRGWGDLICFLGSGPFPVVGTFFLFSGRVSWAAVSAGIVAGLWVDAILYIGNVPDAQADRAVGKRTLSTILGRRAVRTLAPLYYGTAFALVVLSVVLGLFPLWALLSLLSLPILVRILVITRRHYDRVPEFAPAILMTVQVFAVSTVLLGAGFILSKTVG
jgi:1,4-dihydroxy-2-naphthoate octaprenyltransferase